MSSDRQERVELDEIEQIYESRFEAFLRSVTAIVGDVEAGRDAKSLRSQISRPEMSVNDDRLANHP